MTASGHRWLEHTADLCLSVWADDEAALLHEAARALVDALTEGAALGDAEDATRDIEIDALDAEDRLVRWLNEVLYLATTEGVFVRDAELRLRGAGGLSGRVVGPGAGVAAVRAEIKSATYHDLHVRRADGRVVAQVVLDV